MRPSLIRLPHECPPKCKGPRDAYNELRVPCDQPHTIPQRTAWATQHGDRYLCWKTLSSFRDFPPFKDDKERMNDLRI